MEDTQRLFVGLLGNFALDGIVIISINANAWSELLDSIATFNESTKEGRKGTALISNGCHQQRKSEYASGLTLEPTE